MSPVARRLEATAMGGGDRPGRLAPVRADEDLVVSARAGDRSAFAELVQRYQTLVWSLAYSLSGDLARTEELTQDVFVLAWDRLPGLRSPGSFRAWLHGI